ncbi:hypothetical protein ACFL5O_00180 [Myxococcota bacterium]
MTVSSHPSNQTRTAVLVAALLPMAVAALRSTAGCGGPEQSRAADGSGHASGLAGATAGGVQDYGGIAPGGNATAGVATAGTSGQLGGGSFAGLGAVGGAQIAGGAAVASGIAGGPPCTPPPSEQNRHPGTFDDRSCVECHETDDWWGGWVYTDAAGYDWVPDATVTITNPDGTSVTAMTAPDGFFVLSHDSAGRDKIKPGFTPCVSKCSAVTCAINPHDSVDCHTSTCHGAPNQLIYLQGVGGEQNTGGAQSHGGGTQPSGGDSSCSPPALAGPRAHSPQDGFDSQPCIMCHDEGEYTGGFVYDGLNSKIPVARATVTLTPDNGTPITAVTGLGGMFYFPGTVEAPYSVCVSLCPDTRCSTATSHPNADDCRFCHDSSLRIHLP